MSPPVACAAAGCAAKSTDAQEKAAHRTSASRTSPITSFRAMSPDDLAAIGRHPIAGRTIAGNDDLASGLAGAGRIAIVFRLRLALLRPGASVQGARRARMGRAEP